MKPRIKKPPQQLLIFIQKFWQPFVSFFFPLLLYLQTLAPTVYNLDSAELTTAAATLGITRATGYPLYILTGSYSVKFRFSMWVIALIFSQQCAVR